VAELIGAGERKPPGLKCEENPKLGVNSGWHMGKLKEKVAIITGAGSGIGAAVSRLFVAEGASVTLVDQSEKGLADVASSLGQDVCCVTADVSTSEGAQSYVKKTMETFGKVDIFIANAGMIGPPFSVVDTPIELFDRVLAVNVRSMFLGLKSVIPEMTKSGGGSIVMTASTAALRGGSTMAPYVTSKHAVLGLMRAASSECALLNIRVNAVNPGPIATNMIEEISSARASAGSGVTPANVKQGIMARIPMQRYGQPEEVARMMLFLASEDASFCTGGYYVVDGGMTGGP